MWPFRSKEVATALPGEDTWSIAQGESQGKPMFARVNVSAGAQAGDPQLPTRLGIAIPLKAPNEHGFPHGSEFGELDAIEERIVGALRANEGGCLVLVITTGGMREFVSYVQSPAAGEAAVAQVRSATATHEVQHYTEPDAEWTVLKGFTARG